TASPYCSPSYCTHPDLHSSPTRRSSDLRIFEKRPGPALRLNQRKDLQMSKVQPTAGLVTAGMIGGYVAARVTKIRPLGGIVLGACGIAAGRRWYRASGPGTTALLST